MRNALAIILPLLAPTLLYLMIKYWGGTRPVVAAKDAPWIWLAGGGVLLAAAVLGLWTAFSGAAPDAQYVPARYQDGVLVPEHYVPNDPATK